LDTMFEALRVNVAANSGKVAVHDC
jgi:hypothetical protein